MANTIKLKNSGTTTNSPSALEYGELAINYADGKLFYKDDAGSIVDFANARSSVSDTAPSNPSEGDVWFESDTGDVYVYYDSVWVDVGGTSVANIAMSDTAPSSPINGDFWFETDTGRTFVYYDDGTSQQWIEVGATSAAANGSDGAIQFASGGTFSSDASNFYWDDTNNRVGIGTTSPNETLDVQGSIGFSTGGGRTAGSLFSDSNWGLITTAAQSSPAIAEFAWFNAGDTERMRIDTSGNVGINDTTPSYKLDVNGDINATGNLLVGGTSVGTGIVSLVHKTDADITLTTTSSTLLTSTITTSASRYYLAHVSTIIFGVGSTIAQIEIQVGGVTKVISQVEGDGTIDRGNCTCSIIVQGTGGSAEWRVRGLTSSGTATFSSSGGRGAYFTVVDLGEI